MIKDGAGKALLNFTLILRFLQFSQARLRPPRRTMTVLLRSQAKSSTAEMVAAFDGCVLNITREAHALSQLITSNSYNKTKRYEEDTGDMLDETAG